MKYRQLRPTSLKILNLLLTHAMPSELGGSPLAWHDIELPLYVVSVPHCIGRRMRVTERLKQKGLKWRFVDAIDGDDSILLRKSFRFELGTGPRIYQPTHRNKPISDRELACTLSHFLAIKQAWYDRSPMALIVEDDFEFGVTQPGDIIQLLEELPADAAYAQLIVVPAATIRELAAHHDQSNCLFVRKNDDYPIRFEEGALVNLSCHSTSAYLITELGIASIVENFFDKDTVLLPCNIQDFDTNIALLADRLVFQAATRGGGRGYACTLPTFQYEGLDSLIHPSHLGDHREAMEVAKIHSHRIGERRRRV